MAVLYCTYICRPTLRLEPWCGSKHHEYRDSVMSDDISSASSGAEQFLREKKCPDCGSAVFGRTLHKQYCTACRDARTRQTDVRAAEKQRRKRGVPKVKGATLKCAECRTDFVASSGGRTATCEACRPAAALSRARQYAFSIDKNGARERFLGQSIACACCGETFVAERFAKKCIPCRARKKIPFSGVSSCSDCGEQFVAENRKRKLCDHCRESRSTEADRENARKKFARMRGDPVFDLNTLMRSRMRHSLNGKKGGASWSHLTGYDAGQLRHHLERQFLPGMTWENRGAGGWHIDHIVPIASFNYDGPSHPDFKACWALTNLRPLWASDNIRKKDSRTFLI